MLLAQARDGGRRACDTPNRGLTHRMAEAGRTSGHPVAARAARARSRFQMQELLEPVAKLGDVWRLGEHIVVCGDATHATTAALALNGQIPNLMVTDQPYGVSYDPEWRERAQRAGLLGKKYGAAATGRVLNDDRTDWRDAWALFPGDVAYLWHSSLHGHEARTSLIAGGFEIRSQIIWDKGRLIISRGHYHWRHEPCWYAVRRGRTASWVGDRKQVTVWPVVHRRSRSGHSTEKPVELMRRPMLNHTVVGDRVYDPFLGSGTTLMAAEELGRICHGIELDPGHVDRTIRRWEAATGRRAERSGHG